MVYRTRYRLYESLVMPFGLTNAPADFQHFINNALRPFLYHFYIAYLDNILIYSVMLDKHREHVQKVLEALSKVGLNIKPEKCHFHKTEVKYLGLIISADGVRMDLEKVTAILEWGSPCNLYDVYTFLEFANFYWQFIVGYSNVVAPLVRPTKKGVMVGTGIYFVVLRPHLFIVAY